MVQCPNREQAYGSTGVVSAKASAFFKLKSLVQFWILAGCVKRTVANIATIDRAKNNFFILKCVFC